MQPPPTRPRALLLDAMGTLVRLDPPGPRLRRELAARFGLAVSPAQAERAIAAEIAYYRDHMHDAGDPAAVLQLRQAAAEALRLGLPKGASLPEVSTGELADALLASLHFTAYPDVLQALAGARERGLRLVVVSNWDSSLPEILRRIGVTERVDGVVTSAGCGAAKPDPAIFRAALALAGVPAKAAVHVGDSLEEDVAGARGAGVSAIWLDRAGAGTGICIATGTRTRRQVRSELGAQEEYPPSTTISSLSELARLV